MELRLFMATFFWRRVGYSWFGRFAFTSRSYECAMFEWSLIAERSSTSKVIEPPQTLINSLTDTSYIRWRHIKYVSSITHSVYAHTHNIISFKTCMRLVSTFHLLNTSESIVPINSCHFPNLKCLTIVPASITLAIQSSRIKLVTKIKHLYNNSAKK